ncbi:MAG: hypothetical protein ABWX68_12870 [Arthrobacter sp.]|uniref:hypothetical protein n=1 Tax=Arthrobacter sp. TaxID=1667 RepID=UPI003492933A
MSTSDTTSTSPTLIPTAMSSRNRLAYCAPPLTAFAEWLGGSVVARNDGTEIGVVFPEGHAASAGAVAGDFDPIAGDGSMLAASAAGSPVSSPATCRAR